MKTPWFKCSTPPVRAGWYEVKGKGRRYYSRGQNPILDTWSRLDCNLKAGPLVTTQDQWRGQTYHSWRKTCVVWDSEA